MTTNLGLAGKVAKHVELETVVLKRATIESDFEPDAPPQEIGLSQQYRCRYERKGEPSADRVTIWVDFQFFAKKIEAGEEIGDAVKLDATFVLTYSLPSDLTIEEHCFQHFAEVNGPYNAWPYWRELVQSATGRVGLSGITVPVYRPPKREVDDLPCVASAIDSE